jgi:cytochrome c553
MKIKVLIVILGLCGMAATFEQSRKTSEGVYTNAQAERGLQIVEYYGCRSCHGDYLEGGVEEEPPLAGQEFLTAWTGRKLDELAEKITTMPANLDSQYQVKPAAAVDVVAYLLRANGYPAGTKALPHDPAPRPSLEIGAP